MTFDPRRGADTCPRDRDCLTFTPAKDDSHLPPPLGGTKVRPHRKVDACTCPHRGGLFYICPHGGEQTFAPMEGGKHLFPATRRGNRTRLLSFWGNYQTLNCETFAPTEGETINPTEGLNHLSSQGRTAQHLSPRKERKDDPTEGCCHLSPRGGLDLIPAKGDSHLSPLEGTNM